MTEKMDVPNPWEQKNKDEELIQQRMSRVKHKIAIISGKGGVGKSLVTVNLAAALARDKKVAMLDSDLTGPCIPKMLGLKGSRLDAGPVGIGPVVGPMGIRVVSMDFLLPSDDSPVIWRGPLKMSAIRLVDLEGTSQEEAGAAMGVSRGTIWRLLNGGRMKVARALTEGRRLEILQPREP